MKSNSAKDRLDQLEAVVTALSHPARRQILLAIKFRGGRMSAGGVARRFSCAWPTISRHLRVLEHAGLLTHEIEGRTRTYRLEESRLRVLKEWLAWFDEKEFSIDEAE